MNVLLARIRSTLVELDLGLKGDLTISEPMERLMQVRTTAPCSLPSTTRTAFLCRADLDCCRML